MSNNKELVARLLVWVGPIESGYEAPAAGRAMRDAASAIEALEAEVKRLTKALQDQVKQYPGYSDIARKALEE